MVNSLLAPVAGSPTSPPKVVAEISGREGHHDFKNLNMEPYARLVAQELHMRGYFHLPNEIWQLHIAEQLPGCEASGYRATTIKNKSIALKVQPGDKDSMRQCYLVPPPRLAGVEDTDKVFQALKSLNNNLLEWAKDVQAKTGTNIVELLTDTSDVEALIKDNSPWRDGPSQEEIATFCGYVSDDVQDGNIQTRKLNSGLTRLAELSQPPQLWLALARYRFVNQGLISRNGDGFRLTAGVRETLEVVRKENDFAPPGEVDAYLRELTESEAVRRKLVNQRAELGTRLDGVSAKVLEATTALERAKQERGQIEGELLEIADKLRQPKLVAHNKALEKIRKQLGASTG